MMVGNFSDQLQQDLVAALQQVLPSGTSILITTIQDLVTNGLSRRRLLATNAARRCDPAAWRWMGMKSSCILQKARNAAGVLTPVACALQPAPGTEPLGEHGHERGRAGRKPDLQLRQCDPRHLSAEFQLRNPGEPCDLRAASCHTSPPYVMDWHSSVRCALCWFAVHHAVAMRCRLPGTC